MSFSVVITDANGNQCQQALELTVVPQELCPQWEDTVWTTSKTEFPPTSVATVFPDVPGGTGNAFEARIKSSFNIQGLANATGVLIYNGPAAPIIISGNMIKVPAGTSPHLGKLRIDITIGMVTTQTLLIDNAAVVLPPAIPMVTGPFSIPFTIPDTGGQDATITLVADMQYNFGGSPYDLQIQGSVYCCPEITNPNPLPDATQFIFYSEQLALEGCAGVCTFAIGSGSLPPGLLMNGSGLISGIPTTAGTYNFRVDVTDSLGGTCPTDMSMDVVAVVCPDWSQLTWVAPTLLSSGAAFSDFNPNAPANTASFDGVAAVMDASTGSASASSNATLVFNGGPCNCQLDITVSMPDGTPANMRATVDIPILGFSKDFNVIGPGIFNYPFSVPSTGGMPINIQVFVTIEAPYNGTPAEAETIIVNGTFSNV